MSTAAWILLLVILALALGAVGGRGGTRLTGDPSVPWEDEGDVIGTSLDPEQNRREVST